jgi:hypothetical protein
LKGETINIFDAVFIYFLFEKKKVAFVDNYKKHGSATDAINSMAPYKLHLYEA